MSSTPSTPSMPIMPPIIFTPTTPPMSHTFSAPLAALELGTPFEYQVQNSGTSAYSNDGVACSIAMPKSIIDNPDNISSTSSGLQTDSWPTGDVSIPFGMTVDAAPRETPFLALLSAAQLLHVESRDCRCKEPTDVVTERKCTLWIASTQHMIPWEQGDASRAAGPRVSYIWARSKLLYAEALWSDLPVVRAVSEVSFDTRAQDAAQCIVRELGKRGIPAHEGHTKDFWEEVLKPVLSQKQANGANSTTAQIPTEPTPPHSLVADEDMGRGGISISTAPSSASPASTKFAPANFVDLTVDVDEGEGKGEDPAESGPASPPGSVLPASTTSTPAALVNLTSYGEENAGEGGDAGIAGPDPTSLASSTLNDAVGRLIGEDVSSAEDEDSNDSPVKSLKRGAAGDEAAKHSQDKKPRRPQRDGAAGKKYAIHGHPEFRLKERSDAATETQREKRQKTVSGCNKKFS